MDIFTCQERSLIMSKIRSKNTKPELVIRKLIWHLGYRYRIYYKNLPGKPDLVFVRKKKIIYIHGCFWHRHDGCSNANFPKSNTEYWIDKFRRNQERDMIICQKLNELGWKYLIIWECEVKNKNIDHLKSKIVGFLEDNLSL